MGDWTWRVLSPVVHSLKTPSAFPSPRLCCLLSVIPALDHAARQTSRIQSVLSILRARCTLSADQDSPLPFLGYSNSNRPNSQPMKRRLSEVATGMVHLKPRRMATEAQMRW